MEGSGSVSDEEGGPAPRVFVSYATADRKRALGVCTAIEKRGVHCWIANRDVPPGANYQEAIVEAIRNARAMVLVFSAAANDSDEIKKELSLASRYRVPLMALRIEAVEPSDAFAYELSTRQWIDVADGWDRSIEAVVGRIAQLPDAAAVADIVTPTPRGRRAGFGRKSMVVAAGAALLLLVIAAGAWRLNTSRAAPHSMTVRLAGFQPLSADLPATIKAAVDSEIAAAFNADGVVGVSTATVPPPGTGSAYALGGTIQRDGPAIRVITRLTNERSGATLWSETYDYDGAEVGRVPRHIAVDAGNVVRCGLFGASTSSKALPDAVLKDYLQFCQGHWNPHLEDGRKALVPAQRVVAAAPDFSWGWAAVAGAYWKVALTADDDRLADQARAEGRAAADKAIAIDGRNSEALYIKSVLTDHTAWVERERLLQRAVAARRLDCGCEHHQYGWLLASVGRTTAALDQLRQADDMLALYLYTPLTLANALVEAGKADESKAYFDAARELAPDANFAATVAMYKATATGDVQGLADPRLPMSSGLRAALIAGYKAAALPDAGAKARAVRALMALPDEARGEPVVLVLGALGADHEAFLIAGQLATLEYPGPSLFWYPSMRGALSDPGFPALAARLRLIDYWKATRTRPDVCAEAARPPFCQLI